MKTLASLLLLILLLSNVTWFSAYYDLRADYDQEMGLRDESDSLLRLCQIQNANNSAAASELERKYHEIPNGDFTVACGNHADATVLPWYDNTKLTVSCGQ